MGSTRRFFSHALMAGLGLLALAYPILIQATLTLAAPAADEQSVRRLISLVEYIGGDYTEAVRQGQVVNADEYKEMQDFAASAGREFAKIAARLEPAAKTDIQSNLDALGLLIKQKADVSAVRALTSAVKNRVIEALAVDTTPLAHPDLAAAIPLYARDCASCHGVSGRGDGPAGANLEPPARNFHEDGVMQVSSPFKFYNTLQLGVEGTAMTSYAGLLSEAELWSLAFYVTALRHGELNAATPEAVWQKLPQAQRQALTKGGLSLALLSRSSDAELGVWLENQVKIAPGDRPAVLQALRVAAPFLKATPRTAAAGLAPGQPDGLTPEAPAQTATAGLSQAAELAEQLDHAVAQTAAAKSLFDAADYDGAEAALLDAYLEGFEAVESALGVKRADLVHRVEQGFIAAREAARARDAAAFGQAVAALEDDLAASRSQLLETPSSWAGASEFVASLVIILREGFEAFLVVAALLALMNKTGAVAARKWIHGGWIAAIAAGLATFGLFNWVFEVSGAARETIEAVSTALAAAVLFYVSFWLLNQAERTRWERYLKNSTKAALGEGQRTGAIFFLAFIAVYREAAETVLFYQALGSTATNPPMVWLGFGLGAVLLLGICGAISRLGVRLPLRSFFLGTSTLMILISIVLAGKAVHELIEAGFVQPTRLSLIPAVEILGIYPNLESLAAQAAAAVLAGVLVYLSLRQRPLAH